MKVELIFYSNENSKFIINHSISSRQLISLSLLYSMDDTSLHQLAATLDRSCWNMQVHVLQKIALMVWSMIFSATTLMYFSSQYKDWKDGFRKPLQNRPPWNRELTIVRNRNSQSLTVIFPDGTQSLLVKISAKYSNNCHHYVARVLELYGYNGKK